MSYEDMIADIGTYMDIFEVDLDSVHSMNEDKQTVEPRDESQGPEDKSWG